MVVGDYMLIWFIVVKVSVFDLQMVLWDGDEHC